MSQLPPAPPRLLGRPPFGSLRGRLLVVAPLLALTVAGTLTAGGAFDQSPVASPQAQLPSPTASPSAQPTLAPVRTATPTPTAAPTVAPPTPSPTPDGSISLPPDKLSGFVWPLRNARFTSGFKARRDGSLLIDGERIHAAIDLATWCGDRVRAAHAGVVLYAGRKFDEHIGYSDSLDDFYAHINRVGGLELLPIAVVIDYGNGYRGLYAHLSRARVKAGDVVDAGQVIGSEGATGRATGCHLHYALIRMDGPWMEVVPELVERYGYPPFTRERVNPLLVLPRGDQYAPSRIRERYRQRFRPGPEGPFDQQVFATAR